MPLEEGANDFEIVLADKEEILAREERSIFCGFLPPTLKINKLPDVTGAPEITLSGTALDVNQLKSILTLKINSEIVDINPKDGSWSKTYPLTQGTNHFDILVYDGALRKTVIREIIEHHPQAPEIVLKGIGPVITCRQMEFVGHVTNFDYKQMTIRIHDKNVPVADDAFHYKTSIRTDKADIPFSIDFYGRPILNFTRQVVFLPSPPTITLDDEIKQISATHCRISGTITDENDINPKVIINQKEILPRAGAWMATLALKPGVNTIIIEGHNQSGLKKILKKRIFVPDHPNEVI
jgi:hypothetical protein